MMRVFSLSVKLSMIATYKFGNILCARIYAMYTDSILYNLICYSISLIVIKESYLWLPFKWSNCVNILYGNYFFIPMVFGPTCALQLIRRDTYYLPREIGTNRGEAMCGQGWSTKSFAEKYKILLVKLLLIKKYTLNTLAWLTNK